MSVTANGYILLSGMIKTFWNQTVVVVAQPHVYTKIAYFNWVNFMVYDLISIKTVYQEVIRDKTNKAR